MNLYLEIQAHPKIKYQSIVKNKQKNVELEIEIENLDETIKYPGLLSFVNLKFILFYFDISKRNELISTFQKIEKLLLFNEHSKDILISETEFKSKMQETEIFTIDLKKRIDFEETWRTNKEAWSVNPCTTRTKLVQHLKLTSSLKKTCFVCGKTNLNYYDNTHYVCNIDERNIIDSLIMKIWNQDYVIIKKKIETIKLEAYFETNKIFFWPFVKQVHISVSEFYIKKYVVGDEHEFEFKFKSHPYPIPVQQLKTTINKIKTETANKLRIDCFSISNTACYRSLYGLYHFKQNDNHNVYFNFNYNSNTIQNVEEFVTNLS